MSDQILGSRVRDTRNGYEGIATARIDFHTGCSHYVVESTKLKPDGTMTESYQFDPQRLEIVEGPRKALTVIEPKIKLWSTVQDEVTGFPGFVSAVKASLYGLPQVCIEPDRTRPDGELNMPQWFFESRVIVLSIPDGSEAKVRDPAAPYGYKADGVTPKKKPGGPSPYGCGIEGVR